jgi:hypothetical protein
MSYCETNSSPSNLACPFSVKNNNPAVDILPKALQKSNQRYQPSQHTEFDPDGHAAPPHNVAPIEADFMRPIGKFYISSDVGFGIHSRMRRFPIATGFVFLISVVLQARRKTK